jgi:ABC-type branched-subunit amino acid transport system substrate-binding protein
MKKVPVLFGITAFFCVIGLIIFRNSLSDQGIVRIAVNLPLTGPVAAWSGDYPKGFELGLDEACKAYNIDRKIFVVDFQDNGGKPSQAISVAQKQLSTGFDVYISGSSECSMAVVSEIDPLQIPHFIAAFDPFLASENPSRLRIMANSKIEAPLFIAYAKSKKAKTVHIIHLNSKYAQEEFGRIVQPRLEQEGVKVSSESFDFTTADYKSIAIKAKKINADLTIVAGYSFHLRPLINEIRTAGMLVEEGKVMGAMDVVDFFYDGTSALELNNMIFACPIFDLSDGLNKTNDFRKIFHSKFGKNPSYVPAYAYDNAWAIVKAYHEFGKVSVKGIRDTLPLMGVTGKIKLDNDGDIEATIEIARIGKNNKIEKINNDQMTGLINK